MRSHPVAVLSASRRALAAAATLAVVTVGAAATAPAAQASAPPCPSGATTIDVAAPTDSATLTSDILNYQCVVIGPGTFVLDGATTVPAGHEVIGSGAGQTILQANPATWATNGSESVLQVQYDTDNVYIGYLTLDANNVADYAIGMRGYTADTTTLENAICNGAGIAGLNDTVENSTITANGFSCPNSPPGSGIYLTGATGSGRQLNPVIKNNTISSNAGPGLDVDGVYGGTFTSNTVSGNGSWAAVSLIGGQGWTINGNSISQPNTSDVQPYHPDCSSTNAPSGLGSAGIILCETTSDTTLATIDNTISNNTVSGHYGILSIGNDPLYMPNSNTISGNVANVGTTTGCADDLTAHKKNANTWTGNNCTGRSNSGPTYF